MDEAILRCEPRPDDIIATAVQWLAENRSVAIATVVRTWGSAPLPVGSQMVVDGDSNFSGSVSGGCIEGAVIDVALDLQLNAPGSKLLRFGVTNERAWEVGLSCGGEIEIFVETLTRVKTDVLQKLQAARAAFLPVALATRISDAHQCLVINGRPAGDLVLDPPSLEDILQRIRTDDSGHIDGGIFARVYNAPLRLVLVGAVHIAQALAPIARCAGFRVIVIDPRTAFATSGRFPDIALHTEWPDVALNRLGINARTALVTLTHDPKLDDPALMAAIRSDAFYIGALGSSKTHAQRRMRLRRAGATEPELARIHAPVGMPLGGRRPAEVAISIIAEMISVLHAAGAG